MAVPRAIAVVPAGGASHPAPNLKITEQSQFACMRPCAAEKLKSTKRSQFSRPIRRRRSRSARAAVAAETLPAAAYHA